MTQENDAELAPLAQPDMLPAQADDSCDVLFSSGISLPGYEDTSDRKVLGAVKQTFKDFSYDATDDAAKQFKDVDSLAAYVKSSIAEMNTVRQAGDRLEVGTNAAILARFWYMAERLNSALSSGSYGQGVGNQLAAQTGLALSTIYSIRAVAVKLTASDCWLLGTRGCKQTHLRKLAGLTDDALRKSIIEAFLKAVPDTSDREAMDKARKSLAAACSKHDQSEFIGIATSDPVNGGTDVEVSEAYTHGMNCLKALEKALRPLADNDRFVETRDSFGMIYVTDQTPDAQAKVDAVHELAAKVKRQIIETADHLACLMGEVESLENALVVTGDEAQG